MLVHASESGNTKSLILLYPFSYLASAKLLGLLHRVGQLLVSRLGQVDRHRGSHYAHRAQDVEGKRWVEPAL